MPEYFDPRDRIFFEWQSNGCSDDKLFADFYEAAWMDVFSGVDRKMCNASDSENIAREAFIKLFEKSRNEPIKYPVYLTKKIANDLLRDFISASESRRGREQRYVEERSQDSDNCSDEERERIRDWFKTIKDEEHQFLLLYSNNVDNSDELGKQIGMSASAVRKKYSRLKEKARAWFKKSSLKQPQKK